MTPDQIKLLKNRLNGMSEEALDKVIDELKKASTTKYLPTDIFPLGTTAPTDTAVVSYLSRPEDHQDLIDFLNSNEGPRHRDLRTFTLGIIRDDFVKTEISIGGLNG